MGRPITSFDLLSADRTTESLTRKGRHAGRTLQHGRMLLRLADGVSGYTVADELEQFSGLCTEFEVPSGMKAYSIDLRERVAAACAEPQARIYQ